MEEINTTENDSDTVLINNNINISVNVVLKTHYPVSTVTVKNTCQSLWVMSHRRMCKQN